MYGSVFTRLTANLTQGGEASIYVPDSPLCGFYSQLNRLSGIGLHGCALHRRIGR